jgi:YHS domain-containing protein
MTLRGFGMGNSGAKAIKLTLLGILVAVLPATLVLAGEAFQPINTDELGVAIKGYDTVAYFTEGRAVRGNSEFAHTWNDATWYFSSVENKDLFAASPEHYTPQYGGYCSGYLALTGKIGGVNPEAWKIIDGRLYLARGKNERDGFAENAAENIKKADENWASLNN